MAETANTWKIELVHSSKLVGILGGLFVCHLYINQAPTKEMDVLFTVTVA